MEHFISRKPIFDSGLQVVAFELLDILRGKPAFVNFPRGLLLAGGASVLPPHGVVIQIPETVEADEQVVAACESLRSKGYSLALDDRAPAEESHPLMPLMRYLKVDFQSTTVDDRRRIAQKYGAGVRLLAQNVETRDEYSHAKEMGYKLFQGYFFAEPVIVSRKEVPESRVAYLRILDELHREEMDYARLGALLRRAPSLVYKLLRYVNSAMFGFRQQIGSVEHAISLIGEEGVRRWLSVALVMDMTTDTPSELMTNALARARFGELLAPEARLSQRSGDLFLMGLLSRMDAIYGRPLEDVLGDLSLHDDVRRILLGAAPPDWPLARLWRLVSFYESAQWRGVAQLVEALQIPQEKVSGLYTAALAWSDEVER